MLYCAKEGDTIILSEIVKQTLSIKDLYEIINVVKEKHLELIIGTFKIDCRKELDPVTEGILKSMSICIEIENNKEVQYIQSINLGIERAKEEGKKLGRPKTNRETLLSLFLKYYHQYLIGKVNQTELAKLCKTSRQSISKYIKIMKKSAQEEFEYEIDRDITKEVEKEYKKEEIRKKSLKRWTIGELNRKVKDELVDLAQEGVSDATPFAKELLRRQCKAEKMADEAMLTLSLINDFDYKGKYKNIF